ncbi:MAG TPA: prephenate dehydratase [Pirellulales bacterium]|jgi:chorismate mutase/prephenate dehydratase|nr:prephenate dehydratase [Pirellulales bacterium]
MAKEPSGSKKSAHASQASLRHDIERADRDLLKLLNTRAALSSKLASVADAADPHILAAGDFQPVLDRVIEQNKGPLSNNCVRTIYRELLSGARALERHERVAFLGPSYSYSHLAALERFGTSIEQVPVGSISAVFEEVNRGHVEYGVVPVENSTDGRIADTLDMFTRLRVRICGEVHLPIHHTLLGRCERADVIEVYSRPQALSQCRNWLIKHLPNARAVEVTSTSTAAQLAQDKQGAAAIASVQAGVYYGLNVLAENIEDNAANVTRFVVIGHDSAPRSGRDQLALMFEIEHKPGGLADALAIFKRNRLNLTWIESFPIARPEGGYMFFVELDGHETDARVRKALAALERKALRMEILGSFPRSKA